MDPCEFSSPVASLEPGVFFLPAMIRDFFMEFCVLGEEGEDGAQTSPVVSHSLKKLY